MAYGYSPPSGHRSPQTLQLPPGYRHPGRPTHDDRTWALGAYLGQFILAFVAPGIVYLLKARSPFVRRHAAQGLNLGLTGAAVWLIGGLLAQSSLTLLWFPALFSLVSLAFLIKAAMAANQGDWYRVPRFVAWPLVK
ncbi:MAG: hypothetical protein QOE54_1413 [Streptosporangiaceae bacterium]|jgi:uncharacterized Tic20 family protein|nr:hypothetical protein [Streptosporangiaceae bacterium]MDX6429047.1 hypothetical protein [Streptosporangiaceae bacterium]